MKLSIITINYNNAVGLQKTLNSTLSQKCTAFEHVIVDGASSDNSVELIERYATDASAKGIKVIWISEKDKGIYNAMNKGIKMASGEYVEILNSGDILAAGDVVTRMYKALDEKSYPEILYGNMLKTVDWVHIKRDNCGGNSEYTPKSFLYFYNGTLNHNCAYIKRSLFDKYGYYNEEMKICSDWEWYVRSIVLGNITPIYVNLDVTIFDMNGVSESGGKNKHIIEKEKKDFLESIIPKLILNDYYNYSSIIVKYQRLKRYKLWNIIYLIERVLFKVDKVRNRFNTYKLK